jgi:NHL repeat
LAILAIVMAAVTAPCQTRHFSTAAGLATTNGFSDGTNSSARFFDPSGIAVNSAGVVYVADYDNHTIRRLIRSGPNWIVTTIAGSAGNPGSANGTNSVARFTNPKGLAVDASGTLFLTDYGNHTVRKISPVGTNWVTTTIAGSAGNPGNRNGSNSVARFTNPKGIALDGAGTLYVADFGNETMRRITLTGTNWVVTTMAGSVGNFGSADGTNSSARFNAPNGVAVDSSTNVYVADYGNDTIRKLRSSGTNWIVTTIAGFPLSAGSDDGTNDFAEFHFPSGLAIDSSGQLYVADTFNYTIRKMTPMGTNWVVTTIAGTAKTNGVTDGIGKAARFWNPSGVAIDSAGYLYVADTLNQTIRFGQILPSLQISAAANQAFVSWPASASNFLLETSSSLGAPWVTVTNGIGISGSYLIRTNSLDDAAAFFRLRRM